MKMLRLEREIRRKYLFFFCHSSASNRIIHAKDHASIQLTLADVDPETGRMTDTHKMYAICGAIRRMVLLLVYIQIYITHFIIFFE